ncbi:M1 family metallopeptidase [Aggregicoccus sp. 17bor-14]|uniref:ABC transporter permease/M1 family aminopeptidase n=1 Tax=Myxococcaceae TaxID=31 RepID=UPI00129C51AC|nr:MULTISPECIES: ABC transporter permease [Myxococcaceae]MBF5043314.1 ABC transporter permease [Simulacricoccus sp. 17bor-14]MRI89073.1 M1 family metallopeptidase [Aggregicoccus sp. 17bor-14]
MSLREVVRYELSLQARRVFPWLCFVALAGISYQASVEAQFEQARDGGFFFNAPIAIALTTLIASLLGLLVSAQLSGDAAARDVQLRMHPLVFTTPVGKGTYLGGRFLGAFLLNALILLAVPLGLLLATLAPGLEPEGFGPFRPAAYLGAYFFLALPNAFLAVALGFTLAALSRRAVASYLAGVLIFVAMMVSVAVVAHKLGHWALGKLLDPLGFGVLSELSKAWTSGEKNTRLIALEGSLLANRLLWMGVSLGLLALTHWRFRFAHPLTAPRRWGRRARATSELQGAAAPIAVPRVQGRFGAAARARQVAAVAGHSFRALVTGGGAYALVGLPLLVVLLAPEVVNHMGIPLLPTTEQMLAFLGTSGDLFWLLIPLFTLWCAGELVWREREAGLSEMSDATPVPDGVPFLGKLGGFALVLVALHALLLAACLLVQVSAGYTHFEPGLYLRGLFGLQLADRLLFALLALCVHVLVDSKYLGHLLGVLAHGLRTFGASMGLEHHLLVYGANPGWTYSDMSGFGPSVGPWLWFTLYWAAWALLLAVAARLLWVRGREGARLRQARWRFGRPVAATAVLAMALILGVGGFILYNTNVLNTFRTSAGARAQRAEYERRYAQYADLLQPQLTGTQLRVELYPQRREAVVRGTYQLVNRGTAPIETLHLEPAPDVETAVRFDRPATVQVSDEALGHRIYALAEPLQPGDTLPLHFEVRYAPRGFPNDGPDAAVTANGTYFVQQQLLPALGYQRRRELSNAGDRRKYGLVPRPAVRALDDSDEGARAGGGPRIAFEAVVGTEEGQVALAPGVLRRTWSEGGRRYFHYVADAPIDNDYAFYSAHYAVAEGRWKDVALQVFHHPGHTHNVARTLKSMEASLDYLSSQFGPYPHRALRFIEHPGSGLSLHGGPMNISYLEGFSLLNPEQDPRGIDFPFAVAAHEVSHQWFCGQVAPAWVEGAPLMCESLAWYAALSVVEKTHGTAHMERVMDLMREAYLSPRTRAGPPLLKAVDWFLAYRKGPFAMYALREYVGEARVNAALRRMVERYGAGLPPLPTSRDLYRELQAVTPEAQRGLLHDLFEENTYWSLETKRAAAEPAGDGTWWVTLDVLARKEVVDTEGRATEVPMDDLVEVGVYAAGKDGEQGEPLSLERHHVHSGAQQLRVRVKGEPARAGIDPRHLLIDVKPDDNVEEVAPQKLALSPPQPGSGG